LAEPPDFVHGGCADQPAIEGIRPRVVRTLDRLGQPARGRFAEARAAVAADVVVRMPLARLIAQHDDALARDLHDEVVARRRQRGVAPHTDPMACEDALLLLGEDLRRRVVTAGQRPRALLIALGRPQGCYRITREALRPAAPGLPPD